MRITNLFFNEQIRDSESVLIQFLWTSSVLFGWIKLIFELKNLIEFFIRHYIWVVWWKRQLNYTNQINNINQNENTDTSKDFRVMYGSKPIFQQPNETDQKENSVDDQIAPTQKIFGKCWAVVTGPTNSLGVEYCKQIASQGFNICLIDQDKSRMTKIEEDLKQKYPDIKTLSI